MLLQTVRTTDVYWGCCYLSVCLSDCCCCSWYFEMSVTLISCTLVILSAKLCVVFRYCWAEWCSPAVRSTVLLEVLLHHKPSTHRQLLRARHFWSAYGMSYVCVVVCVCALVRDWFDLLTTVKLLKDALVRAACERLWVITNYAGGLVHGSICTCSSALVKSSASHTVTRELCHSFFIPFTHCASCFAIWVTLATNQGHSFSGHMYWASITVTRMYRLTITKWQRG